MEMEVDVAADVDADVKMYMHQGHRRHTEVRRRALVCTCRDGG